MATGMNGMKERELLQGALLLAPDNFTPLTRTPWAGTALSRGIKRSIVADVQIPIGESWELSCDPQFPSQLAASAVSLPALLHRYPDEILSPNWRKRFAVPHGEVLVKLINAADPLSLQVHPPDDDPHLAPDECGKPEAWLVLEAEAGAGVYVGFSKALGSNLLSERLATHPPDSIAKLLQFVPVKANDYFEIAPGTPHAIGKGLVLLEVQRILPGKSGKTYRLWDWNRRYDQTGKQNSAGSPRELHLDAGLALIDPLHQVGSSYVETLRRSGLHSTPPGGGTLLQFPANDYCKLERWQGDSPSQLPIDLGEGYGWVSAIGGTAELISRFGTSVLLPQGYSALLPYTAGPFLCRAIFRLDLLIVRNHTPSN